MSSPVVSYCSQIMPYATDIYIYGCMQEGDYTSTANNYACSVSYITLHIQGSSASPAQAPPAATSPSWKCDRVSLLGPGHDSQAISEGFLAGIQQGYMRACRLQTTGFMLKNARTQSVEHELETGGPIYIGVYRDFMDFGSPNSKKSINHPLLI